MIQGDRIKLSENKNLQSGKKIYALLHKNQIVDNITALVVKNILNR